MPHTSVDSTLTRFCTFATSVLTKTARQASVLSRAFAKPSLTARSGGSRPVWRWTAASGSRGVYARCWGETGVVIRAWDADRDEDSDECVLYLTYHEETEADIKELLYRWAGAVRTDQPLDLRGLFACADVHAQAARARRLN